MRHGDEGLAQFGLGLPIDQEWMCDDVREAFEFD